jgi:hypothetical protein
MTDPNEFKRLTFGERWRKHDPIKMGNWDDKSLSNYLEKTHRLNLDELRSAAEKLKAVKFEESNLWQKLLSLFWYGFARKELQLTPKKLMYILSNLDKLLPFIPNEVAQKIIIILDQAAEAIYKKMDADK